MLWFERKLIHSLIFFVKFRKFFKMNFSLIYICLFVTIGLSHVHSVLTEETTSSGDTLIEGNVHRRHRHRHRHHHNENNELSSDAGEQEGSGNVEFVAAYRAASTLEEDEGQGDNGGSSSMESRLANLEQDVRHLCLEDEEDVERRIRALGVKCICPKTEAPVCGSDDVTYYNRCFLHCRAQAAEMGYHRYKITLKKFGPCSVRS